MSESPAAAVVALDDISLAFGEKKVLDGVNLQVAPQERLVIMGQSGSGKSTILRLILGILRPSSGRVLFLGNEVSRMKWRELAYIRSRIGMVYQYSALVSSLNVRDNLALPLEELTRKTRKEIDQVIDEKLEMVGMATTKDQMPSELSGGMKKRISLARALVMEPELILYDEPSAGLDPVISSVIDELIIDMSETTRATSIIVTHEMDSAFRVGTRMAMLYEGQIIADDTPAQFKKHKNPVVRQFLSGETEGPMTKAVRKPDADTEK